MKHATRRQIHAYGLAALLLLVVALGVALAMLGHSTMSGGPQWSGGALGGVIIAASIVVLVALGVGGTLGTEEVARWRRRRASQRPAAPVQPDHDHGLADEILGVRSANYTERFLAGTAVYELDDAAVDELITARRHRRQENRRVLTHRR